MKKIIKGIYSAIPFKKQLFSVVRRFNPPASIYRHLHFNGVFKVKTEGKDFKIKHYGYELENDLFWKGLDKWEQTSLSLWEKLCKRSNVIIDIGANTGVYSLVASTVNKSAKVYAFEPLAYKQLLENVKLNDLNIVPSKVAISNKNGEASFFTNDTEFSYSASLNQKHHDYENKLSIKVQTKTLDSFCEENKIVPDLVKIDVERHEPEVIEGFMNTIKRHHPTMLIEVLDEGIGNRLYELFKDTPYLYYSINDETGTYNRIEQMGKSDDFNILVCTKEVAQGLSL